MSKEMYTKEEHFQALYKERIILQDHYIQKVGSVNAMQVIGMVYTQAELDEAVKAERDKRTELKDAYAETFERYIPDEYLGEANNFLLSRFKDNEASKAIVDRKEAIRARSK